MDINIEEFLIEQMKKENYKGTLNQFIRGGIYEIEELLKLQEDLSDKELSAKERNNG